MKYTTYDWDKEATPTFDKLLAEMTPQCKSGEEVLLLQLLNKPEVGPWFESCLPQYNEYFKALEFENPCDFTGFTFHKGFRQIDIVQQTSESMEIDGCIDMKIWKLLQNVNVFWKSLDTVLNGK